MDRRILDCQSNPLQRPSQWRRRDAELYHNLDGQVGKGTRHLQRDFRIGSGHMLISGCGQIKAENPTNDAIIDDVAGQAYVEQFGSETFQRADRAVQADKVTKSVINRVWRGGMLIGT